MNKIEALQQVEVFCRKTFSQFNYSEWQIKTEDGFSYLQGMLLQDIFCPTPPFLTQCQYKIWVEYRNKYSKKLIVAVEADLAVDRDSGPFFSWVFLRSNKKKILSLGDVELLTETKKTIMEPILNFIENEIQAKIDLPKKAKKNSWSQLTIDFLESKI